MGKIINTAIRPVLHKLGINVVRYRAYPPDFSEENIDICEVVKPYTMTSELRVNALIDAVHYVVTNEIKGAMVECGVWKGGSAMAIASTLIKLGDVDRELYLYDTFAGMTPPGSSDISVFGDEAEKIFTKTKKSRDRSDWCLSSLDEVKANMSSTGYPMEKMKFIAGKVEETIPEHTPKEIALLRLDTDWYESTKHELTHLFPLLQRHGVLIVDDYGHWAGAKKAVDEYVSENNLRILLNRIDRSGRIAVKS
jgi:O-methyltransferase